MIFDSVKNTDLYKGLSATLDAALDYMKEHDLNAMEPGRYPVCGGKVLVIVKKGYETREESTAKWESHRKNLDIQYMLEGEEVIGFAPAGDLEVRTPYEEEGDKALYYNPDWKGFRTHLKAGDFIVLFPDDAHATCMDPNGQRFTCNKAVIKVAID